MGAGPGTAQQLLVTTESAAVAARIEEVLGEAGIPLERGLLTGRHPRIAFLVPEDRLASAQTVLELHFGKDLPDAQDELGAEEAAGPAGPPWGAIQAVAALVLLHVVLVLIRGQVDPDAELLRRAGGLVAGATAAEPWRLLSSLFVHSGLRHVLGNAVSMVVFAVPLIESRGYLATALCYLASGVAGGLVALSTAAPGTVFVGSSGAVSGLFGAWVASTLRRARRDPLPRRAWLRGIGIGLLVLPSLLTSVGPDGRAISVEAHLGGLLCGAVIGGWLFGRGDRVSARPRVH